MGRMPTVFDSTYTGTNVVVVVDVVVVVLPGFVVGVGTVVAEGADVLPAEVPADVASVVATALATTAAVVVVVESSKICSGASSRRALPWNTARTAFMLSLFSRGSMTD